jgi:quinol monooxygenase YgiN
VSKEGDLFLEEEMAAPLIPQDIFFIERYSSIAYFEQLKNAFAAFVDAVEKAVAITA